MSASPAHGDRPPLQSLRRSFTTPTRQLSMHEKAGLEKTDANADVLYTHPSARIVSFSPPTDSIRSSSKAEIPPDTDYPIDTVETLPWRSRTETLAASGILRIEKVRGSTNFLKCQEVMHAILRNSQCWCVDGESKFVLRVRQFKYYRIELPSTTDEDKAKVEELKKVLPTVLRFERTPCPFIRAFTVDLPDDAITPRRKGQWKRRDSSQPNISDSETPPLSRGKATRSWSMKSPPTSYPRNGPGYTSTFERGRPGSSAGPHRRDSSFDHYRNSSPASYVPSEDGSDSEHQESEHDSDKENVTDRSGTASPRTEFDDSRVTDRSIRGRISAIEANEKISPNDPALHHKSNAETPDEEPEHEDSENEAEEAAAHNTHHEIVEDVEDKDGIHRGEPIFDGTDVQSTSNNDVAQSISPVIQTTDPSNSEVKDVRQLDIKERTPLTATTMGDKQLCLRDERSATPLTETSVLALDSEQPQIPDKAEMQTSQTSYESDQEPILHGITDKETPAVGTDISNAEIVVEVPLAQIPQVNVSSKVHQLEAVSDSTSESSVQNDSSSDLGSELEDGNTVSEIAKDVVPVRTVEELASKDSLEESISVGQYGGQHAAIDSNADSLSSPGNPPGAELSTEEGEGKGEDDNDDNDDDTLSVVSSVDSFHTMASNIPTSPTSPRKNGPTLGSRLPSFDKDSRHKRGLSEMTVTPSSMNARTASEHDVPATCEQDHSGDPLLMRSSEVDDLGQDMPSSSIQSPDGLRQRLKSRRSFSPLPPPSTIFTGNQIRHDSGSGHMTKAILQKVIVKPIEVVVLVMHILARIAGGATVNDLLSGELFKRPEHRRSVSGFADQLVDGRRNDSDTDDDFGVPIRGRRRSTERRLAMVLDEVDEDAVEDID